MRGFLLALTRQVPFYTDGLQPELAWISAFGVEPAWRGAGLGSALLTASLDRLRRLGCRTVTVGPYQPYYFMPGVDVTAYAAALKFLLRSGFLPVWYPIDLLADLAALRRPPQVDVRTAHLAESGVIIRPVEPADIVPVLSFVRDQFGWSWHRGARHLLALFAAGEESPVGIQVAVREATILGYAAHEGPWFGPLGVHPNWQGRGIGTVLTGETLQAMRQQGHPAVHVRFTYDELATWYAKFGFREARRYALLERNWDEEATIDP